jgi:phospholipid/cholesterol/gamma-HCH transport system substrate-binding protein
MSRIIRLGLFIFIGLIAFGSGVFLIGQKELLFTRTYHLLAPFENVAGLANGSEVRVGGVHVGTVDHISIPQSPKEKVQVVMNLKDSTQGVIRKDSVAVILTEGLLGDKFVSISYGSPNSPSVKDGDLIQSEEPVDLSDIIHKSGAVLESTQKTIDNLTVASDHFKAISTKIDKGQGTMGSLINDRSVYNNLNQTVAKAQQGVTSFQENMEALKGNFFIRGFFKKRGYVDSSDLTNNEIPKLPDQPAAKTFVCYSKDIFDKSDSAKLKNTKLLKQVGEFLQQNPFKFAAVTACTDFRGEKVKNLEISRARAMAVRNYLVQNFKVDDSRIKTKGMGEDDHSDPNKAGRVEVFVYE